MFTQTVRLRSTLFAVSRVLPGNQKLIAVENVTAEFVVDEPLALRNILSLLVPKFASHLIYLTKASNPNQVEKRIVNSIFGNNSKRADLYWFVHIDITDEPYTMEYGVEEIKDDMVVRIDFRVGFRVQPRIGLMLRKVVEEMMGNKEIDILSRYPSMNIEDLHNFRFVLMERFLSYDNEFSFRDGFILNSYFAINKISLSDSKAYGLDSNQTTVEMIPLVVTPATNIRLKRDFYKLEGKEKA